MNRQTHSAAQLMKRFGFPAALALCFSAASLAQVSSFAEDGAPSGQISPQTPAPSPPASEVPLRRVVRIGMTGAVYHASASISAAGAVVPGASASLANQYTATADLSYLITSRFSSSLFVGVPIKPTLYGTGAAGPYGALGKVLYGPAVATAEYRLKRIGRFQPYLGAGPAYAIIFKNYDAALARLKVPNHLGTALQGGAECRINPKIALFFDFKQVFLSVNASGHIGGSVPAKSRVALNPSLPTAGLAYSF